MTNLQTVILLLIAAINMGAAALCLGILLFARLSRRAQWAVLLAVLAAHGLLLTTRPAQLVLSNVIVLASSVAAAAVLSAGL